MFSRILVANRGEIALRVIRAARDLGIASVAVYSEADAESLHVRHADESVCIGPPISAKSYLNMEAILDAAKKTGVEAVQPGYGYLAENGDFARACRDADLVFVGPTPENLDLAGDKIRAKTMRGFKSQSKVLAHPYLASVLRGRGGECVTCGR